MQTTYVTDWKVARAQTRQLPAGTSLTARHLYSMIAGHLNAAGETWPSIDTLADETGMHPGTVRRARAELERAGLLLTIVGGGNRPNLYRLPVLDPASWARGVDNARPRAHGARPRAHDAPTPRPRRDVVVEEEIEETHARPAAFTDAASARVWRRQYTDSAAEQ